MYRNLGPARSIRRLEEAVRLRWPANPVSTGTLGNWGTRDGWVKLIAEYELGLKEGTEKGGGIERGVKGGVVVDDVGVLEQAASQALAAALRATSVAVRNPSDIKALVETANKALELADRLKERREGKATSLEVAEFGSKLLADIDIARRKDFIFMAKTAAESACAEAGTSNLVEVLKKTAGALGMRVNDDGVFYDLEPEKLTIVQPEKLVIETLDEALIPAEVETVVSGADESNRIIEESSGDLESWLQQLRGDLPFPT